MTITTRAPPPGPQLEPTATGGITSLPIEIIYVILDYLSPLDICKLALVSRLFHNFISSYWLHYHTLNPRPSLTLTESIKHHWTPAQLALHNHTSDLNWSNRVGVAQELLQIGKIPPQSVMAVGSNRIFVSTFLKVKMLDLAVKLPPRRPKGLDVTWPQAVVSGVGDIPEPSSSNRSPNARRRTAITDVTSMIVPYNDDDGPNSRLCIGTADGRVARFHINSSTNAPHTRHRAQNSKPLLQITETARYTHPKSRVNALIQESPTMTSDATSSSSDLMASLAHHVIPGYRGLVSLYHIQSPWTLPQTLLLPGMPVCGLLSSSATSNSPYIAIGTRENASSNSTTLDSHNDEWWTHHPLKHSRHWPKASYTSSPGIAVHPLSPTQLSPDPLALLAPLPRSGTTASSSTSSQPPRRRMLNAPYAMCAPSPTAPFGSSSNIILSGWYDSHVLVHDLRVPPTSHSSSSSPTPLSPVLSFHDRFTDSAVYSLGMGGGSGSHIVAGMASHGVLEIFDARNPRRSWGLYSPGKTSASVYQLHVEGSRIWGLTDRLFVVDMGPEAQGSDITPMVWAHHADSIRPRPDRPARMQSRNFCS